jgi:protein-tyrosine-phosphatase
VAVASAGTLPAAHVQPEILDALREQGVDAATAFPKPLTDEVVNHADIVVTMGCGDACPVIPGRRYLDWDLPDPQGQDLETVRRIRDTIAERVTLLLTELDGAATTVHTPRPTEGSA